jgi:nucleotide-binding universal stress UspA family protein
MNVRPSILCPVDFSDASAGALQYAAALAEHFATRLIVLSVDDPRIAAIHAEAGLDRRAEDRQSALAAFLARTFANDEARLAMCEPDVVVGKPSAEILRVARERSCDLIVMSRRGGNGISRLLFGSTTQRVLRETSIPVLVTPPHNPGRIGVEDAAHLIERIVVPVDLSDATAHQARVAAGLAVALGLPLTMLHVLQPQRNPLAEGAHLGPGEAERLAGADAALRRLLATVPGHVQSDTVIAHGDPAEEAAQIVRDRQAGLVVMGLRASPIAGPRMGSVAYRLLCLCPAMVLALPPQRVAKSKPAVLPAALSAIAAAHR